MKEFKDFDRQFSEMRRETIGFRVFGRDYSIPKCIPAVIPLEMARWEDEDQLPTRVLFRAAEGIFGEENLREWGKHPEFDLTMLAEMVKWAFGAIAGEKDEERAEVTEDDGPTEGRRKN